MGSILSYWHIDCSSPVDTCSSDSVYVTSLSFLYNNCRGWQTHLHTHSIMHLSKNTHARTHICTEGHRPFQQLKPDPSTAESRGWQQARHVERNEKRVWRSGEKMSGWRAGRDNNGRHIKIPQLSDSQKCFLSRLILTFPETLAVSLVGDHFCKVLLIQMNSNLICQDSKYSLSG